MKDEQYASLEIKKIMIMDALLLEILSNADIKSNTRCVYALVIFMNNATKLSNYFIIVKMLLGLRITSNFRHIRKATEDKTDILWFWYSTALQ